MRNFQEILVQGDGPIGNHSCYDYSRHLELEVRGIMCSIQLWKMAHAVQLVVKRVLLNYRSIVLYQLT